MGLNSLQYFARDFLGIYYDLPNPDAGLRMVGLINLAVIMLSAVGTGMLSDRVGRRQLIVMGAMVSALTTVLMALTRDFTAFLVLTIVRAVATGPIMAVIPALASGLVPQEEAGQYMAYSNMTTAMPSALAPLLFGAILNLGGATTPASFVTLLLSRGRLLPVRRHRLRTASDPEGPGGCHPMNDQRDPGRLNLIGPWPKRWNDGFLSDSAHRRAAG
jgi:MFS family permease